MTVSILPEQIAALAGLIREVDAFAVEVEAEQYMGLGVMTFTRLDTAPDDDDAVRVRWFSVSCVGTVRERESEPEQVAA
jgi:hypothetical protein